MGDRMSAIARYAVFVASACLLGCGTASEDERLEVPAVLRTGLRAAALGCWRITDDPSGVGLRNTWWLPLHVRLDTAFARNVSAPAYRVAWRLDTLGNRLLKDVEGFSIVDSWAADSASDRIVISTANGLYGAVMVLSPSTVSPSDTMGGHGQEYGDVYPQPQVPIVPVLAIRVECHQPTVVDLGA